MSAPFPTRPRLGDHVLARRHLVGDEEHVVLHDLRTGRLVKIGPREWTLLAAADGTRDLPGVVLAAAREGAHAREPALRAYLGQLHEAGLLHDDSQPPSSEIETLETAPLTPPDRPLSLLPDFSLHCDGSGSCCRLYASVLFAPIEAARARALLPEILDGGARPERVFLPEHGPGPCAGAAVAMIDGRCAYLADSGWCKLHTKAGPTAKPLGCSLFPASFVDDGERVRVSTWVECACVLASVGRPGGAPLIDPAAQTRGDLDPAVHVARLPERALVRDGEHAPAASLRRFMDDLAACAPPRDIPRALWSLADRLESKGLERTARFDPDPPSIDADALRPWIEALHARASRRARDDEAWRSDRDLARLGTIAIADATRALLLPSALAALLEQPPPAPASEAFSLRATLHGLRLIGELPLTHALRDHAVRLLVARALPPALGTDDRAFDHPLALLEAMLRGHGLSVYAHDLLP
ncbi:MAG: YkgJ family cysteine cluster protein [Minicystis sp.]